MRIEKPKRKVGFTVLKIEIIGLQEESGGQFYTPPPPPLPHKTIFRNKVTLYIAGSAIWIIRSKFWNRMKISIFLVNSEVWAHGRGQQRPPTCPSPARCPKITFPKYGHMIYRWKQIFKQNQDFNLFSVDFEVQAHFHSLSNKI